MILVNFTELLDSFGLTSPITNLSNKRKIVAENVLRFVHFNVVFFSCFQLSWTFVDLYQLLIERVLSTLLAETHWHTFDVLNVACNSALKSCCYIHS